MPRSGDEWFQKSDEWYAAASLFIEAPFGSHAAHSLFFGRKCSEKIHNLELNNRCRSHLDKHNDSLISSDLPRSCETLLLRMTVSAALRLTAQMGVQGQGV
jgi:hypothetical protein